MALRLAEGSAGEPASDSGSRVKFALLVLTCAVLAGFAGGSAAGRSSAVEVTLVLGGVPKDAASATRNAGEAVGLTARAKLATGQYLGILVQRDGESSSRSVARCARPTCTATWRELAARTVAFTAIVWDIVDGRVRQLGASKSISVTWKSASSSGPRPTHLVGKTSQGKRLSLDVSPDGSSITNLTFAEVDSEGACSLAGSGVLTGVAIPLPTSGTISAAVMADGFFSFSGAYDFKFDDRKEGHAEASVQGRLSGSNAQGTATITIGFNYEGVGQICTGTAEWSASLDRSGITAPVTTIAPTYLRPASEPSPRPGPPGP